VKPDRICPHCGKPIAADRKRYCGNCGEDFTGPDDAAQEAPPGRRVSGRGILLGIFIALVEPLSSLAVAFVWDRGVVQLEPNGPFVQALQGAALLEIILGPLGIAVAGQSARLRSVLAWYVLVAVAVPVLAVVWFIGTAYLGGLAGEPF
jgi:hypothetical protein